MKFRYLALAFITFVAIGCGHLTVKQQIDKNDRIAFTALHEFQNVEEAAYHSHQAWPTEQQHKDIGAALSKAYGLVIEVAQAGIAVKDGQTLPDNIKNDVAILTKLVADVVGMAAGSPALSQATAAQSKVAALTNTVAGRK